MPGRWFNLRDDGGAPSGGGGGWLGAWFASRSRSSGNRAFDGYRAETLRRLEEEQREFQDYLERLHRARDKAEFDGFMAERGRKAPGPDAPGGGAAEQTEPAGPRA